MSYYLFYIYLFTIILSKRQNDLVDDGHRLILKGDAWFGSVKAAANLAERGIECIMQVKTSHSLFPKSFIEEKLKDSPGGVHIVLKGRHPNGKILIAMGYRYSGKKTLFFIMTSGAGSTLPGPKFESKYTDEYGNVGEFNFVLFYCVKLNTNSLSVSFSTEIREVDRPDVITKFYRDSNSVDKNNQRRQHELALEKKWITQNCYFRLTTTLFGICVTDTANLMHFHDLFPSSVRRRCEDTGDNRSVPLRSYAGNLASQMLKKADMIEEEARTTMARAISRMDSTSSEDTTVTDDSTQIQHENETIDNDITYISASGREYHGCLLIDTILDGKGCEHRLGKFPVIESGLKQKKRRARVQQCYLCGKETTMFCIDCNAAYCYSDNFHGHGRKCFQRHLPRRNNRRST